MLYNCHPTSVVNKVVSLFKKRKRYQSFLFHALNVVLFVRIFKLLLLGFFWKHSTSNKDTARNCVTRCFTTVFNERLLKNCFNFIESF